jgi:hypothetical protein
VEARDNELFEKSLRTKFLKRSEFSNVEWLSLHSLDRKDQEKSQALIFRKKSVDIICALPKTKQSLSEIVLLDKNDNEIDSNTQTIVFCFQQEALIEQAEEATH